MPIDWNDIRLVIEIARSGSLSGAASALGTSKPTVSRRLVALEQIAGARLFSRTPQGASLTESGAKLVLQASRIEESVLDFEAALKALGKDPSRMVSVRMSEGVASYLIAPVLSGQDLGPLGIAARKEGVLFPPIRIVSPAEPEAADISLVWAPVGAVPDVPASSKVRRLAEIAFVPFVGDSYQAPALPTAIEDLAGHPLVTLNAYRWFSDENWMMWHRAVESGPKAIASNWSCSVGHFTFQGVGIGLLPSYTVLYTDSLKPLSISAPPLRAALWMAWPAEGGNDPLVRQCIDALAKTFSRADWMVPRP